MVKNCVWAGAIGVALIFGALRALAQPQTTFYWCEPLHGYYPQIRDCPVAWRPVPLSELQPQIDAAAKAKADADAAARAKAEADTEDAQRQKREAAAARKAAEEAAKRTEEQQEAKRKDEQREAARKTAEALAARKSADDAAGYKHVTVADVLVDFDRMDDGDKVILTGYLSSFGQMFDISEAPMSMHSLAVDPEGMSRETRKKLLDCEHCYVTIWAKPGCYVTAFGQKSSAPCLMISALKVGTYESGGAILY
jgi:hypothetical protein